MKTIVLFYLLLVITTSFPQNFLREMPDEKLRSQITKENFPKEEAVIILKEQSIDMNESTVYYKGEDFKGPAVNTAKVIIVKLLTEAAVRRYGSFEFEYYEPFGDDIPFGFAIKVRVLKSDNKIEVLDDKEIKKIVSVTRSDGSPMRRKVLFKIPNLAVGDIVQIEYKLNEGFSESFGGTIFYNDVDYVIISNAYLTLPSTAEFNIYSFPEEKIKRPVIQQMSDDLGSGKTYFWSVRNLNSIPSEPYSFPFEDQSYMTAFSVKYKWGYKDKTLDWHSLGQYFFEKVVDKGSVTRSDIEDLNLPKEITKINFSKIDSLYSNLKKSFRLINNNTIYPVRKLTNLLKSKKGDATDLSFLMYKILEKWGQKPNIVLIRDLRKGMFDVNVPILEWFDRMGVMVTIDGEERVYDFDRSISSTYDQPWFLNPVNVFVICEDTSYNKALSFSSNPEKNSIVERHIIKITPELTVTDSIVMNFYGSNAENLRKKFYDGEPQDIKDYFRTRLLSTCLIKTDTIEVNDFLNDSDFTITAFGKSSATVEYVDSFLVVKVKNDIFKILRDKLTTSNRKGHIKFDSPFQYKYLCDIHLPTGYTIKNPSGEHEINSPFKSVFKLRISQKGDIIRINGELNVPEDKIAQSKYIDLMTYLDKVIKLIEKDIVLKRVS